jgi:hypothetical protein
MNDYNDLHLKARNMRLELEETGLWMCLVYIVPETIGLGTGNYMDGLSLQPYPPINAHPAYPEFQDPSGFKNQPEPIYGNAIPYQPVMPGQQNNGYEKPMIDMYQGPHPGANDYPQAPMNQMQPIYDNAPQNLMMAKPHSNKMEYPDPTYGIAISQKDA